MPYSSSSSDASLPLPHISAPPRPFVHSLLAMLGIGMVNLLVALDQTTVSTALPAMIASLNGFHFYPWIAGAYLLAQLIAVPVSGRLGDQYGRKQFVVAAIVIFTIASVLCAAAPTMVTLIMARALQGLGAGMMTGSAFASIPDLFPDPKARVRWQVVLAAAYGIGTSAGPSLGGVLTVHAGWRSTFLINLPVGITALYCVLRYLPRFLPAVSGSGRIDFLGALLLALLLTCLLVATGSIHIGEAHEMAIAGFALPLICLAFYLCERRAPSPIVPLEIFRSRQMVTLFCLSLLVGAVMFSLIFYVPLMLQAGLGMSAADAGAKATPLAVSVALGSLANTRIVTRLKRPAGVLVLGFALLALASLGIAQTGASRTHGLLQLWLLAAGIGLGLILNNVNIFAQETAGRAFFGIATSLIQSTRMIGGLFGVSLIGTWVTQRYAMRVGSVLDRLSDGHADAHWTVLFGDPQILIDPRRQAEAVHRLAQAPFDATRAIDALRQMFIVVLDNGFALCAILTACGIVVTLSIRTIELRATEDPYKQFRRSGPGGSSMPMG
jgi:MFS family permease